jgi:hypothetical protein
MGDNSAALDIRIVLVVERSTRKVETTKPPKNAILRTDRIRW